MVEFAINYSVHALTQHAPFFVKSLLRPRLPTLFECDSWIREGGNRSCKNRSWFCSSNVVTYDADVDQVDVKEEDHLNNSDGSMIESYNNDDAGIFSIANYYPSEDDNILADEQKEESTLSAARTRRAEQTNT